MLLILLINYEIEIKLILESEMFLYSFLMSDSGLGY